MSSATSRFSRCGCGDGSGCRYGDDDGGDDDGGGDDGGCRSIAVSSCSWIDSNRHRCGMPMVRRRQTCTGVLNPFIRLDAFWGLDGLIVEARPSKVSRMVFLDKDLEESDVPFVESVIGPSFPAISLNFLAIPVRPSADPLKSSTSSPNKSIRSFAGNLFSSTPNADAGAGAGADDDADIDADVDADADADADAVDIVAVVDDDDDAVNADVAAAMDFAIAVAVPLLVSLACLFFLLRDKDICICDTIFAEPAGVASNGTTPNRFRLGLSVVLVVDAAIPDGIKRSFQNLSFWLYGFQFSFVSG